MYEESERVIRDRIDTTRERMGETIEEIGARVNPSRVQRELKTRAREQVDEMKANVKRKARNTMRDVEHGVTDTGRGVWDRIRENPIPAGMVGVGLAWLVANGGSHEPRGSRPRSSALSSGYPRPGTGEEYGATVGYTATAYDTVGVDREEEPGRAARAADKVREKGHDVADRIREKGHEAADTAREKGVELKHRAEETMHDTGERARQWGREAQYRARRIEHRVEDSVQENPITAGAIAAALGFAAGMMIPESRKENEMFGPTRDRVMDRASSTARRAGAKAKEVARETAGEAAKGAMDEVMHPEGQDGESQGISEPGR